MKTWHFETGVVAGVLAWVAVASGDRLVDWIGATAVLLTFNHAVIADRMREREASREVHEVECFRWSERYFVMKEFLWLIYFWAHRVWPALVGVVLFILYPVWRRVWRSFHPIQVQP